MGLVNAISYVTGGFSLVAFIVAAIFYGYREHLRQRRALILTAPAIDRIKAIDITADYLRIDTGGLSNPAKERLILEEMKARSRRDLMIFSSSIFFGLILAVITIMAIVYPRPVASASSPVLPSSPSLVEPAHSPSPAPPRVFTHPDVKREGQMVKIKVTVIADGNGGGSYNVDFYWTGSGGTWSGSQTAVITILGTEDQPLQSIPIAIDRKGCYYGGGNHQAAGGQLQFDPKLADKISVTLSEVRYRTEGIC